VIVTGKEARPLQVARVIDAFLASNSMMSYIGQKVEQNSDGGWRVTVGTSEGTYLRGRRGQRIDVRALTLVVLLKRRLSPVELHPGRFRDAQIASGSGTAPIGSFQVVVVEREGQAPKALMVMGRGNETLVSSFTSSEHDDGAASVEDMQCLIGPLPEVADHEELE
jgi:hypothetical protein